MENPLPNPRIASADRHPNRLLRVIVEEIHQHRLAGAHGSSERRCSTKDVVGPAPVLLDGLNP